MSRTRAGMGSDRVEPGDPRYAELIRRGVNKRFAGRPDYVRLVRSPEEAVIAVQEAVRENRRIAVRSGGHCLEGFVEEPAVRVVVDTSLMTGVDYDPDRNAFVVQAGSTLGEVYRRLFYGWGVTLPAGESPDIGVGGHVSGGAFGFLCRQHGLAADHLYAVEVVVVDEAGTAKSVVATRDASDPLRELWWAHTGGGGGNFGLLTRCWFRSPDATGTDPSLLLPKAPESVLAFRVAWNWEDIDSAGFARLVRNFGEWCQRNAGADSPAHVYSLLFLRRHEYGKLEMKGVSTAGAEAERLFEEQLAAVNRGLGAPCTRAIERSSWLAFALNPFPELFRASTGDAYFKVKDAFLRRPFTDSQLDCAYRYLTRTDYNVPGGMWGLATYGGKVNAVAPHATASAQRDSILSTSYSAGWVDPRDEPAGLAWVRGFYRDNYPRLQQAKARWDPRNVFQHALSVRPA